MNLNVVFLQAGAPPAGAGTMQLVMIVLIMVTFWLFFIRPQSKKAKEQQKFIDNLQKGDKIVTISGIHGVVNKINEDNTLQLEVSPGSYLKVEKSAVSKEWSHQINKPASTEKK